MAEHLIILYPLPIPNARNHPPNFFEHVECIPFFNICKPDLDLSSALYYMVGLVISIMLYIAVYYM